MRLFATLGFLLSYVLCSCVLPLASDAAPKTAADAASVFIQPQYTMPIWSDDPLTIDLLPDEQACKKLYKKTWQEGCATAPGQSNAPIMGLHLSPKLPGQWRWNTSTSMTFTPSQPWPDNTRFSLDLSSLRLPERVRMAPKTLQFTTLPLAAALDKGEMWIDPDLKGKRAISFAIRFSTPPDRSMIENQAHLTSTDPQLSHGPLQFVWTEGDTRCLVSAPVLTLPQNPALLSLQLPKVRAMAQNNEEWQLLEGTAQQSVTVPGSSTLFKVTKASLECVKNAQLEDEYHLVLRTSLRVKAEDMLPQLTIVELPATQNAEAETPYRWDAAPAISTEDIKKGKPLTPTITSIAEESGDVLRFRLPVTAGRHVLCALPAGFGPQAGLGLPSLWQGVFHAAPPQPSVAFLQTGNVLTLKGERKLDLVSHGLTSIKWRASRILKNRMNIYADKYRPFSDEWTNLDSGVDVVEGSIKLPTSTATLSPTFSVLDISPMLKSAVATGLIRLELTGMWNDEKVAHSQRLLLVTDLGMVIKNTADGSRDVFVCSLSSGEPASKVKVQIIGQNGLPVAEDVTNTQGHVRLPAVEGLIREKRAVAVVASTESATGTDMAWMSLQDISTDVDYSRFDTQGQYASPNNVSAYIFPQRGIFRPGDSLHFGILLRRGDWQSLPPDMPLKVSLYNPAGKVVMQRSFTYGDGLSTQSWDSPPNATTGKYQIDVSTSDGFMVLGNSSVRVEEFEPDRMSISAELVSRSIAKNAPATAEKPDYQPLPAGWLSLAATDGITTEVAVRVKLRNLYGLPAANRRVATRMDIRPTSFQYANNKELSTYSFNDLLPWKQPVYGQNLPEVYTNDAGEALVPIDVSHMRSRNLSCAVSVEGFEAESGRAVRAEVDATFAPFPYILGYRPAAAQSNLNFLPKNSDAALDFTAINAALTPVATEALTFTIAKRRYVTSLVSDKDGQYGYDESPLEQNISSTKHTLTATGPLLWKIPTDVAGEYLLNVSTAKGTLLARIPYTVAGTDDLRPTQLTNGAELPSSSLRVRTDKSDYAPGDKVQLFVSAPYDGVGLITLERDTVVSHAWFKAKAGNSMQSIVIPPNFEGRGFINISVARSLSSPDIFLQPYTYALAPISVNISARDMGLQVSTPALSLPGQSMQVQVKAQKPGRVVVFAVDEGILQFTKFATPDPLKFLLLDRALSVQTHQLFSKLMPDHAQLRKILPAFGGDSDEELTAQGNPFKRKNEPPLVWWSEPQEIGPQGLSLSIPLPDYYSGTVRVMAVGASASTAGKAETQGLVHGSLIITPQVPLLVSPADIFTGSLNIANTTAHAQQLRLNFTADAAIQLDQPLPPQVEVPAHAEISLPMQCSVGNILGNTHMHFSLTDAQQVESKRSVSLSVRPPAPLVVDSQSGRTSNSMNITTPRQIYSFDAGTSLAVSAAPLPPLRGLWRYLQAYPFECVEQSISRAFPYALVARQSALAATLMALPEDENQKQAQQAQERAFSVIRSTISSRGLAAWPGSEGNALLLAYAADYLLALREAGLNVPGDLSTSVFNTLETAIDYGVTTMAQAHAQAYGIWVLTREGRITTQHLERLNSFVEMNQQAFSTDVTLSLMAASYAIMRMDTKAQHMLQKALQGMAKPPHMSNFASDDLLNPLAAQALHVAVLARHFPASLAQSGEHLSARMLEALNAPDTYTSLSAAQGIRALLALAGNSAGKAPLPGVNITCTAMQDGFAPLTEAKAQWQEGLLSLDAPGCAQFSLHIPKDAQQNLYWELNSQGYDRTVPKQALTQNMEILREYTTAQGEPLSANARVTQGQVVTVKLTVRLFSAEALSGSPVVLSDLLPGGFEQVYSPEGYQAEPKHYIVRREDRTLVQIPQATGEPYSFSYEIRAVNKGHYSVPAAYAEGMYDRTLRSHTAGGSIRIE